MQEEDNNKSRRWWISRLIGRVILWFKFLGTGNDIPDPDSSGYVDLQDVDAFNTEVTVISSRSYAGVAHLLCLGLALLLGFSLFFVSNWPAKHITLFSWLRWTLMGTSVLGSILYLFNKRMVSTFRFEESFDKYLKDSDMQELERHQIRQLKAIDPAEYYKYVESYYHTLYPSLTFQVVLVNDIKEYPTGWFSRIFYIVWRCVQDLLGLRWGTDLSAPIENSFRSLNDPMPEVRALAYFEWVHDTTYEYLFSYLNPVAVIAGYYTTDWRLFALFVVMLRFFVVRLSQIQAGIKASTAVAQAELSAMQRQCEIEMRVRRARVAEDFTNKLIGSIKAMKKEKPQDRAKAAEAAIQQLQQIGNSTGKPKVAQWIQRKK